MNGGLAITLLILGVVFVIGIAWDYKRREKLLFDDYEQDDDSSSVPTETGKVRVKTREQERNNNLNVIAIYLRTQDHQEIPGNQLLKALLQENLKYSSNKVFNKYAEDQSLLFSVASLTNPGVIDVAKIKGYQSQGVCIFFNVEEVEYPRESFNAMLRCADNLSRKLNCVILNSEYDPITNLWIEYTAQELQYT